MLYIYIYLFIYEYIYITRELLVSYNGQIRTCGKSLENIDVRAKNVDRS